VSFSASARILSFFHSFHSLVLSFIRPSLRPSLHLPYFPAPQSAPLLSPLPHCLVRCYHVCRPRYGPSSQEPPVAWTSKGTQLTRSKYLFFSCPIASIFACAPSATRGQAVHLDADPNGENLLYTNGKTVFIRNLEVFLWLLSGVLLSLGRVSSIP